MIERRQNMFIISSSDKEGHFPPFVSLVFITFTSPVLFKMIVLLLFVVWEITILLILSLTLLFIKHHSFFFFIFCWFYLYGYMITHFDNTFKRFSPFLKIQKMRLFLLQKIQMCAIICVSIFLSIF